MALHKTETMKLNSNTWRSHYAGSVDTSLAGQAITVCGWIDAIRPHGSLIFINLRDCEGILQLIIDENQADLLKLAANWHLEYLIQAEGVVRLRPKELINSQMATGEVELAVTSAKLIAKSSPLPFNLDDANKVSEELGLRYRYLALRSPALQSKLRLRYEVVRTIRDFFYQHHFTEIETPCLTKSTPEGSRDFVVPSRLSEGSFYALPQSPQLFKQLLMASGFDRYFQIARCFRDEDLRADRQPEFTQMDVEMALVSDHTIMELHEQLLREIFLKFKNIALPNPFPKLSYYEAMGLYGSDKPDLRCPWQLIEFNDRFAPLNLPFWQGLKWQLPVSEMIQSEGTNLAFKLDRAAGLKLSGLADKLSRKKIDQYTQLAKKSGLTGPLVYFKLDQSGVLTSSIKDLPESFSKDLIAFSKLQPGDALLVGAGPFIPTSEALGAVRLEAAKEFNGLDTSKFCPLWVYDFPMFIEAQGAITFEHNPFTLPKASDLEALVKDPLIYTSYAYDTVLNGIELGGGSLRIHDLAMQQAVFKVLKIDASRAERDFGYLLKALEFGYPPEGGIAWGLDRLIMLLSGANSLREVLAFPKTHTGSCPLTGAPAPLETT